MEERTNFLIVMTDQQRGDTLGADSPVLTPNLDKLAAEGVTLSNTFCPTPHCCPSRVSFFSGLYPSQHGIWNNVLNDQALSREINPDVRLWSEDLKQAGYRNYFHGKWHLSATESPADRGWIQGHASALPGDRHGYRWRDYREGAGESVSSESGLIQNSGYEAMPLYGLLGADEEEHDRLVVDDAKDSIRKCSKGEEPWSVFVGLFNPHDPYRAPQEFLDLYPLESIVLPLNIDDDFKDRPFVYKRIADTAFKQLGEDGYREAIRHYYASCSYVDSLVGELLATLEYEGAAENTTVIFLSDHGDYCGEHGLFCKGIPCYDSAYHIPAIIKSPGRFEQNGVREESLISLTDFAPTILELAGVDYRRNRFYGRSLLPLLEGESSGQHRETIFMQCNGIELYYSQRILRTKEWKYVFNGFDRDELYNLKQDPEENHNLAGVVGYAKKIKDLSSLLWREAAAVGDGIINGYFTVRLAPHGPGLLFAAEGGED